MIEINLYQPKQLDVTVQFPSTWNELSQKEIIFVAKCLLTEKDEATVRALLLKFVIESRSASSLPENWFLESDPEQLVLDCFPLLDFIFKENTLTNTSDVITIKGVTYYPQTFENITCAEYEDCEVVANKFADRRADDEDILAELVAILFRPASPFPIGDGRGKAVIQSLPKDPEPYTLFNSRTNSYYNYNVDRHVKYFKKLLPEKLYSIFIWYAGNRAQLPSMFPTVYEGGSSDSEPDLMAFTKCIHSGAGPKNGTRQQIRAMKLYEFMFDMEQEAIHAKEMEAEIEKMKKH